MPHDATTPPIDSDDATDEDLLLYIADKEEDLNLAHSAFTEFYSRHVDYLYRTNKRHKAVLGGEQGLDNLIQKTFIRVYRYADTFETGDTNDPDRIRRRVRGWMGTIAKNLIRDRFRVRGNEGLLSPTEWKRMGRDITPDESPADSEELKLVKDALDALPEKQRIVINYTYLYYEPGKEHQRLPDDVSTELQELLAISQPYIRKLRQRGREKIRAYIDEHAS